MPEEYFLYYEELDWCTYINREGYELWYDPACEIWHKDSSSTGKESPLKYYYLSRNRLLYAYRNLFDWKLPVSILYQTMIVCPKNILTALGKGKKAIAKAHWREQKHFSNLETKTNSHDISSIHRTTTFRDMCLYCFLPAGVRHSGNRQPHRQIFRIKSKTPFRHSDTGLSDDDYIPYTVKSFCNKNIL